MASGSSEIQPLSWAKILFMVPRQHRSRSQNSLVESMQALAHAMKKLYAGPAEALDVNDPKVQHALCRVVLSMTSNTGPSHSFFAYYLSEETSNELKRRLFIVCSKLIEQGEARIETGVPPPPDVLVPMHLAVIITLMFQLSWSWESGADKAKHNHEYFRIMNLATALGRFKSPLVNSACNEYLKGTLDCEFLPFEIIGIILNLYALPIIWVTCYTRSFVHLDLMLAAHSMLENSMVMLTSISPTDQKAMTLGVFDCQFKFLCWIYRDEDAVDAVKEQLSSLTHKLTGVYMDYLKTVTKQAEEAEPADPFLVASTNSLLLHAMLNGSCQTISYPEIEDIANKMKFAAAACSIWAPPVWRSDINADFKIVTDHVLPFLRKLNPKTYKTATVSSNTPGFLNLYSDNAEYGHAGFDGEEKLGKACAACFTKREKLLKCGACQSMWYCSSECQKKDWKSHKQLCKAIKKVNSNV